MTKTKNGSARVGSVGTEDTEASAVATLEQPDATTDQATERSNRPHGLAVAEYKIAGAVDERVKGKVIYTKESRNLDDMHKMVEDGKPDNVRRLAQAQIDIIVQRKIRDYFESEEVANILAGKEVEIDGEKLDFSKDSDEQRVSFVMDRGQTLADNYLYGARPAIRGGGSAAAKQALDDKNKLAAEASKDPELAAKLASLGIKF